MFLYFYILHDVLHYILHYAWLCISIEHGEKFWRSSYWSQWWVRTRAWQHDQYKHGELKSWGRPLPVYQLLLLYSGNDCHMEIFTFLRNSCLHELFCLWHYLNMQVMCARKLFRANLYNIICNKHKNSDLQIFWPAKMTSYTVFLH